MYGDFPQSAHFAQGFATKMRYRTRSTERRGVYFVQQFLGHGLMTYVCFVCVLCVFSNKRSGVC